jgi:hypothetical protein
MTSDARPHFIPVKKNPRGPELLYRLRALMHRRRLDRDLEDELAFHVAMKRDALARAGAPDPARTAAVRFGSVSGRRQEVRDMWTFPTLEGLWADLRLAARRLRAGRSFTLAAVGALALGMSVNSTARASASSPSPTLSRCSSSSDRSSRTGACPASSPWRSCEWAARKGLRSRISRP